MQQQDRNLWLSLGSLLASMTTLLCCALPALLVSLGAGAAVVGLVAAFPQLVWLSERKALVFGVAALMIGISALALWRSRDLPCPADPALAAGCRRLRRFSVGLCLGSAAAVVVGAFVAFVLPTVMA